MSRNERLIASLCAMAGVLVLSGCVDYMNRMDTASIGAGDSVRANREIHAVDPWPASATNKSGLGTDSQKAEEVLKKNEDSSDSPTTASN